MNTLHKNDALFNTNLSISHDGGCLSSDAGLVLVKQVMHLLGFKHLTNQYLHLHDTRAYFKHSNTSILEQMILQLVAGYDTDSAANILSNDPIWQLLLEKEHLASQSTISRFLDRFGEKNIEELQQLNQALLDQVHPFHDDSDFIIDLDSTHTDTFGRQEQANYNAHYQTYGYHPLVAFDGVTGYFLKAQLRAGNRYTSHGVGDFIKPLLTHYSKKDSNKKLLVRGDSGFATPDLYESCEAVRARYVIRLKNNARLTQLGEQKISYGNNEWDKKEVNYFSVQYQAKSWNHARRVCIQSVREADELLFQHTFIVTNLDESISPETIFELYNKRGTMENYIKEAKNGFFFDKTDSPTFIENYARMMLSVIAYNLINCLKNIAFDSKQTGMTIQTIRLKFFKVAGKLVKTARKIHLKLSSYHVYQDEFYKIFERLRIWSLASV